MSRVVTVPLARSDCRHDAASPAAAVRSSRASLATWATFAALALLAGAPLAGCDGGVSSEGEGEGDGAEGDAGEGEGDAGEGEGEGEGEGVEVCDDGFDNDGDFLPDCADDDCADDAACVPGLGVTGDPCTANTDCAADDNDPNCVLSGYPGGSCSEFCDLDAPACSGDGVCVPAFANRVGRCADKCASDSDCRDGYGCEFSFFAGQECMPKRDCGDGVREAPEACDGDDVPFTCVQFGALSGTLRCRSTCSDYDTSDCVFPVCGDGVVEGNEDCEGGDAGSTTCADLGYAGGTLACSDCEYFTRGCTSVCGDGVRSPEEACDGDDFAPYAACFGTGTVSCTGDCTVDESACDQQECGDGEITGFERCEGDDLAGATCAGFGYAGGTLVCTGSCFLNRSGCEDTCGDGVAGTSEQCDGADLHEQNCASQGGVGGALACHDDCTFDASGCTMPVCGDGAVQGFEQCDGDDVLNQTCARSGYSGGALACADDCSQLDNSGCTTSCGNHRIEIGEQCDSGLSYYDCGTFGEVGPTVGCDDSCQVTDDQCRVPVCGDGVVEGFEQCEGSTTLTCTDFGYAAGNVACADD
jgi:hypothetical protein